MSPRFEGKVAIITGSSYGIGRATALHFAKEGAQVTVTGRNEQRLEETRQELLNAGVSDSNIAVVAADITTAEGQDRLISTTLEKFGKVNILVNNAGAACPDAQNRPGIEQGIDTYEKTLRLNLQSVIELTQKIRPHLAETKGEIVNVSSMGALPVAWTANPYYTMAKAALDQYSRSAAIDLIPQGIRVNTVNPGIVVTGFVEAMGTSHEDSMQFYNKNAAEPSVLPVGFAGRPEHIAPVIAFLADRAASEYIVGQNIVADGGTMLCLGFHAHNSVQQKAAASK